MTAINKSVRLTAGLLLFFCLQFARLAGSAISGVVLMKDGSPLPGAIVTVTSLSLADKASVITDDRGRFTLADLVLGMYKLTFDLEGFKPLVRRNVFLGQEQVVDLKIILQCRDCKETVTLVDPPALIGFTTASSGKTISREMFKSLPRARNFDALLNTIPGVTNETLLLAGTAVNGASGLENTYLFDGADTGNILDGSPGQNVAVDFIDEVQVITSGAAAEFAGALGGVIRVVTRAGGNEFHGEVVGYYSGAPLRSQYRDVLALDQKDDSKAVYYPYAAYYGMDDDQKFEGGFSLGGNFVRDKLWFFVAIIPSYFKNYSTITDAWEYERIFKRTEQQLNFQARLTSKPVRNLRLGAGVINNFSKYKGELPNAFANFYPAIPYEDRGFSYPNISGNFSADLTLGNSIMLAARAGYFRTNQNRQIFQPDTKPYVQFMTEAPGGYFKTTNVGLLDVPPEYQMPTGFISQPRAVANIVKRSIAEKLSIGFDLSGLMRLTGQHAWKAGFSWARRGQDVDNTPSVPILFFAWDRSFPGGFAYAGSDRGKYGYYAVRNNEVTGPYGDFYKAYGNMLSFYIQDSWSVADRLTFNLGVRAESEYIPSYATGNPDFENVKPIRFDLGDKIAPRLGFIWDVRGDSSLKVFGSYGIFHDVMKLKMAAGAFGGSKWKSTYYSLDTYKWDEIGVNGYYPGRPLLPYPHTIDFRVPASDIVDPELKPMTQQEIALGFEKRLADDLVLSLRYVNRHLLRAIEDIGVWTALGKKYFISNPGGDFIRQKYDQARADGTIPANAPGPSRAVREYDGVSLALDKRFSANWLGGVSYTWSRLWGNYSGLASGDLVERDAPYVERYFDSWYASRTLTLEDAIGPLPGDRPHQFKIYGSYSFPFGLTAGLVANAMSGTPTSTEFAMEYPGYMPYGRADQARSPFLWFANFYVEYNLKLGKNSLNINLNVDNVFDVKTAQRIYPVYNRYAVDVSEERIAQGPWEINDYEPELDPRYLMEADFYGPLTARLGLKFSF